MKNSDIQYKLSVDYVKLYKLLKDDIILIGFSAIDINNKPNFDYSKLVTMSYNNVSESFDLGFILFEGFFTKDGFIKICEKQNIRYLEPNLK